MGFENTAPINPATTGQLNTQSQPGTRFGPGLMLPSLNVQFGFQGATFKNQPFQTPFASFLQGGKFGGSKIRLENIGSEIAQAFAKAGQDASQMFKNLASDVQSASLADLGKINHGMGRGGGGGGHGMET